MFAESHEVFTKFDPVKDECFLVTLFTCGILSICSGLLYLDLFLPSSRRNMGHPQCGLRDV